jgi:hypothetical protein
MGIDKDTQMQLYESRLRLKREMQKALSCISPKAKRLLVAEWEDKYSALFYRELINCARSRDVSETIANWNVDEL